MIPSLPARSLGSALALYGALLLPGIASAQDSLKVPEGVRVGIEYRPGVRPSVVVLPGAGLDSVRTIVTRDLDFSDRFDVIPLAAADSSAIAAVPGGRALNYALFRTLGAGYAVEVVPDGPGITLRLHDIAAGVVRREQRFTFPPAFDVGFRLAVHRAADEVVRWISGTPGSAASQLLFLIERRLYRVDSDGAAVTVLSPAGEEVLSPTWSPDGRRIGYTRFGRGTGSLVVQTLATGERSVVTGTTAALNITPAFSPDGRLLAFARSSEEGTDVYTADVAQNCCLQRLTVGRYSDNLSPTFAPDGRRITFVSTRAGAPQIYVMAADGTDQELFAPFDYGVTGSSNGPEWSPDGASVVFHRDVNRAPQVFVLDVASRRVRQLTSSGRNEDPTWAPDGRHIAFVSDRSGRRQLWVIDLVTGRIRQLTFEGQARLPAWSRRLPEPLPTRP
jgi:TolB protein